jgi:16S rRNA (cytosine967-C5)-methyltransferase
LDKAHLATSKKTFSKTSRQVAFEALRAIDRGAFADVVLDRKLDQSQLSAQDKGLVTELVYGTVRRRRTLDALIDQFGKQPANKQQADLLQILRLGFYQLRYLSHVPDHAVVDTTVQLAKAQRLGKLSGVVNGMLRQYIRGCQPKDLSVSDPSISEPSVGEQTIPNQTILDQTISDQTISDQTQTSQPAVDLPAVDPLVLPNDPIQRLGILHSYPDWIVRVWLSMLPEAEVVALCEWFNQSPQIDLRINLRRYSLAEAEAILQAAGIETERVANVPSALRIKGHMGAIAQIPGYADGWWAIQDSSAQLVGYLLDPKPQETVIDACAAPGGKSMHIAELMGNEGRVWSCDRTASRTRKIQQNIDRLQSSTVRVLMCDSRDQAAFVGQADRVLLDVPCSGLGTLHRHADARWRQTPESVEGLVTLQRELLSHTSSWVKPGGVMVYSTCTLHPAENEAQIEWFLREHEGWEVQLPSETSSESSAETAERAETLSAFTTEQGWVKVWPHRQNMDGFFMAKLRRLAS